MVTITKYVWDTASDCVLSELDENNAVTAVYTNEPQQYGGVLSQRRGTTTHVHHNDALGSTRFLTDSSGNVTDTYVYDAWGATVASTGTTVNPFKWVGKYGYYTDGSTGQVYVRARMYQPAVASWLTYDPIGYQDAINRICYSRNSPSGFTDPSGLFTFGVHVQLTESLLQSHPLFASAPEECQEYIRQVLICCNLSQDTNHFADNNRHFNRSIDRTILVEESEAEGGSDGSTVTLRELRGLIETRSYQRYIAKEWEALQSWNREDCCVPLPILGRLLHSWQDFYAHAVRIDQGGSTRNLGPEVGEPRSSRKGSEGSNWPGFSAFAATPPQKGTPDRPGPLMPSSYNLFLDGEHPNGSEPIAEGSPKFLARTAAAKQFASQKANKVLSDFILECCGKCNLPCGPCVLNPTMVLLARTRGQIVPAYCPRQ